MPMLMLLPLSNIRVYVDILITWTIAFKINANYADCSKQNSYHNIWI